MRKLLVAIFLFVTLLLAPFANAQETANNIFGVHLSNLSEDQLKQASIVVNGNGGAWGYVTVAITLGQCQSSEMQTFFDSARRKKLIPLLRLTTDFDTQKGVYRRVENSETAREWTACLNALNWPTQKRHVILFNEVNHGNEYEGGCDPAHYAQVAKSYATSLHSADLDFIVMLSGLDLYAPHNPPQYCDAGIFMKEMIDSVPDLYDHIDGLASHSYPAGDFTAAPISAGRRSIAGYSWELQELARLGVNKSLLVFITETGWRHGRLDEATVASYAKAAYESIWQSDNRVRAVTPFILTYCGVPFVDFSWKNCLPNNNGGYDETSGFRQVYETVAQLPKIIGDPKQSLTVTFSTRLPKQISAGGPLRFDVELSNGPDSTAIVDARDGYRLKLIDNKTGAASFSNIFALEPGKQTQSIFSFLPEAEALETTVSIGLFKNDTLLLKLADWNPTIVAGQTLSLQTSSLPGVTHDACGFSLTLSDFASRQVYSTDGLCSDNGLINVSNIGGVIIGENYQVTVEKEGYLPVQTEVSFDLTEKKANLPLMLPLDRNGDGRFSFADLKI